MTRSAEQTGAALLTDLRSERVVGIVRASVPVPRSVLDAIIEGGVRLVEVALGTPGALETVRTWQSDPLLGARVGVGTVMDVDDVRAATGVGAHFIVTPHTDDDVLTVANRSAVPVLAGALTPTEIVAAHRAGATAVKVFPVSSVGGADYIRRVRAPLPDVPLVAVGGVDLDAVVDHLDAGCVAVALGSALVGDDLIRRGDLDAIRERARQAAAAARGAGTP